MARADLLKTLFRSYKAGDDAGFRGAAHDIIEEERRKAHVVLANDLTRILENGRNRPASDQALSFQPLPKDSDRGSPLLEIRMPDRYLADLILTQAQKETFQDVIAEFREWDVLETHGLRPSSRLLFCGPPGCGKTATAEVLAGELGLAILYVRFDAVVSSLLGETAANLRKVFDYAASGTWVVLFDEFDAIGRSRDDVTEHGELKRVVNLFLQLLDHFVGRSLVIAATNFEQSLDPALWRRFDEIVRFEQPNREEITELLQLKLRSVPTAAVHTQAVVERLVGMSHAEIERVCTDAMRRKVLRGAKSITEADFERALERQERRKQALAKSRARDGLPCVDEE